MKKLYFVRHGESVANLERRYAGRLDTPLTPKGRQQALIAGIAAKKLNIDLIISSPLSRAYETAKIIAKAVGYPEDKIELNPLLVERDYAGLQGQPWRPDVDLDGIVDVETMDSVLNRSKEIVNLLKQIEAENVLVVSHGTIGSAVRQRILEGHVFKDDDSIPNAEIVRWI